MLQNKTRQRALTKQEKEKKELILIELKTDTKLILLFEVTKLLRQFERDFLCSFLKTKKKQRRETKTRKGKQNKRNEVFCVWRTLH